MMILVSQWIILWAFAFGVFLGYIVSSFVADWSLCHYPDCWHSWIEKHRKRS